MAPIIGGRRPSLERTLSRPDFWRGARAVRAAEYRREELDAGDNISMATARKLARVELIEAKIAEGNHLADIPEFIDWLGPRKTRE